MVIDMNAFSLLRFARLSRASFSYSYLQRQAQDSVAGG